MLTWTRVDVVLPRRVARSYVETLRSARASGEPSLCISMNIARVIHVTYLQTTTMAKNNNTKNQKKSATASDQPAEPRPLSQQAPEIARLLRSARREAAMEEQQARIDEAARRE